MELEKETETGLIEFNPFMPGDNKRLKLQGCLSVYSILLPPGMKRLKTTYICRFYCLYRWLQTVILYRVPGNILISLFSSNATAGIFLQTLLYHSLHWLHCAFSNLLSVGGRYSTRHREYNSLSHLPTSPVIFFVMTFFLWIATMR